MESNFNNIDELISKFIAGEASAEESTFIENWRKESTSNESYFLDAV